MGIHWLLDMSSLGAVRPARILAQKVEKELVLRVMLCSATVMLLKQPNCGFRE